MVQHIFHGGCHDCTQQEINGLNFCIGCQYFNGNWGLPDLNNYIDETERVKFYLKLENKIELDEREEFIIQEIKKERKLTNEKNNNSKDVILNRGLLDDKEIRLLRSNEEECIINNRNTQSSNNSHSQNNITHNSKQSNMIKTLTIVMIIAVLFGLISEI